MIQKIITNDSVKGIVSAMNKKKIKIGTRGSNLALVQTALVIAVINQKHPEIECETIIIHTMGDKILDKPLLEFGGKGVFVTEFEEALLRNEIDLAVHSAKDMPMVLSEGVEIIGVLEREDPRDVLITMRSSKTREQKLSVIGTSSLRRQMQIEALYSDIKCSSIRGNVNTRLKKLSESMYDGIILAAAGIKRLKVDKQKEYEYRYFDVDELTPAGGQGIIAIEGKSNSEISEILNDISDQTAKIELEVERRALELFNAGCHETVAVFSKVSDNKINIWITKNQNGKLIKKHEIATLENRFILVNDMVNSILTFSP